MKIIVKRRLRPTPSPDEPEETSVEDEENQRADSAARKRAELRVLRAVKKNGWWWPDGS